ncbi:MAG: class I SAM-dependent methyltransferase [Myxococcales bacterium]|nr:class I SAM-dependent methyltransferase [Myxococcales bacterium]
MTVRERKYCRVCGGAELRQFLDLGEQPPANALLRAEEIDLPEAKYPLALSHCEGCSLIQTTHVVSPEVLFRNYLYFSSVSQAMAKHFAAYAAQLAERFVPPGGLVVEVGSNDGILLRTLLGRPLRVLGVDPARNVAEVARSRGVPTIADFFTEGLSKQIRKQEGPASVVIANNVVAHIDDLDQVMRGLDQVLDERGVFVMEAPYVVPFLEHLEFDTVYHEHLSYFGVRALESLANRFGFEVFEVQDQPVHGGSLRVFWRRRGAGGEPVDESVPRHLEQERQAGVADRARLDDFAQKVAGLREDIRRLVRELRAKGKRVVGYTAPAKGNVLLNYCELGPHELEYLADATPAKQGLYSPGMHIPILSPEHFRHDRPDYALLFAWNHKDEILEKEKAWRAAGGRFILPVPKVEVV